MSRDAEASDFHAGDQVLYVPRHAHGDVRHADCENGIVTSTNDVNVFVRYRGKTGSQATTPSDLVMVKPALTPAEITSIESCVLELEEIARGIFMDHANLWDNDPTTCPDYRLLMEHVTGLRAMAERWKG